MKDLISALTAPFPARDHEFLRGYAYLTEGAIASRLDEVYPAWSWELLDAPSIRQTAAGITIAQRGRLTVNGVCRDGMGMSAVSMTRDGASEANEAEKSAATDAFKRAARLFGIGRYLLDLPAEVRDIAALDRWLKSAAGASQPQQSPAPRQQPQQSQQQRPQAAPQKQDVQPGDVVRGDALEAWINNNADFAQKPYKKFLGVLYTAAMPLLYGGNTHHMKASIAKAEENSVLKPDMTVAQALIALATRNESAA